MHNERQEKLLNELREKLESLRPENVITPEDLEKVAERDRRTLERIIQEEKEAAAKKKAEEKIKKKLDSLRPENLIDKEKLRECRERERKILEQITKEN